MVAKSSSSSSSCKKMKEVVVDDDNEYTNPKSHNATTTKNTIFDLKLSSFDQEKSSQPKASTNEQSLLEKPTPKVFTCSYCKGEFSTSQALGGHQNAHKQERARDKMQRAIGLVPPFNLYHHPYSSKFTIPYSSSYNKRPPLGVVKTNSMIHKPTYSWPLVHGYGYGYRYGNTGTIGPLLNSQASQDKLRLSGNIGAHSAFNNLNNLSKSLPVVGQGERVQIIRNSSIPNDASTKIDVDNNEGMLDQLKDENNTSLDLSLRL